MNSNRKSARAGARILVTCTGMLFSLLLIAACGRQGPRGQGCTTTDNGDGSYTIDCGDGNVITVWENPPSEPTPGAGLAVTLTASTPANGTHFVAGEQIVLEIGVTDSAGIPLELADLSRANLYMNGPRDTHETRTCSQMLNASTDRDAADRQHHYINLLTTENTNLSVQKGLLVYTLEPITTEAAGTYTVGLRAGTEDPADSVFELLDVQIGIETPEPDLVGHCEDCHQGAMTGVTYMHHVDPRSPGQYGSPDIDSVPVRTCKMCHNQDGYSSVRKCTDGSKAVRSGEVYLCADGTENWSYMVDPIIRRVHGVHMGADLASSFNTDPDWGDFGDYLELEFPANIKNCTKCHVDDRWKTEPSALACGSCHDRVDFIAGTYDPPIYGSSCSTDPECIADLGSTYATCNGGTCELALHPGGPLEDDSLCTICHTATPGQGLSPIPDRHDPSVTPGTYDVTLTLSPATNGSYYVDESPLLTISITDAGTGAVLDPTTMLESTFYRAQLFVSGPRTGTQPALTMAAAGAAEARAIAQSANGTFDLTGGGSLDLSLDGGTPFSILVSAGTFADPAAATNTEVAAWLNANATFSAATVAYDPSSRVDLKSIARGAGASIEIVGGTAAGALGLTAGTYLPADTASYASNELRIRTDPLDADPRIMHTSTQIAYQLDSVTGLAPGTYNVLSRIRPTRSAPYSVGRLTFQVGTATEDSKPASGCISCHEESRMHGFARFEPDVCKNCHDYRRQMPERGVDDPLDGWGGMAASGRSNFGFGAAPLARRIHGVHRGHYLDKPEEVHGSFDVSGIIFPQDIRNCKKCHEETDTWAQKPSRLVCLACHDTDADVAHGTVMTVDPTPWDPWNGDEAESCGACHGPGKDFETAVMHNIWDPYVPPYVR